MRSRNIDCCCGWSAGCNKNQHTYLYPVINAIEGNNRLGVLFHLLLGADYDSAEGKLEVNTLKNTMIIDGLAALPTVTRTDIEKKYKRFHPSDTINQVFEKRNSMLYERTISTVFIHGKTMSKFNDLNMSMDDVK